MESIAELIVGLRKVMEEQRGAFRESLDVTKRQRTALTGRDGEVLQKLTADEIRLGLQLKEMEEERKAIWTRIATASGRLEADLTWDILSVNLSTEQAQGFSALLDELNDLLRELVTENGVNLHLLQRGLERTEVVLQAARGEGAGTYGPDGQKGTAAGPTRVDRTA